MSVSITGDCPCGHWIEYNVPKPKKFTFGISKATCAKCLSTFMLKTRKEGVDVKLDFGILELSPVAEAVIQKRIDEQQRLEKIKSEG